MCSYRCLIFTIIQLLVIGKCQIEELELTPDIWEDNADLLKLEDQESPDFLSQGYRISEAKCLENIWQVEQEEKRVATVMKYNRYGLLTVTGGRNAKPSEFPHMGALGWPTTSGDWAFNCGSFLISDQFLVTAAHCRKARSDTKPKLRSLRPTIVRLGVENKIKGDKGRKPVDMEISKFIPHKNFHITNPYHYDIALIKLTQKVEFSQFIRPVCIMNIKSDKAIVTGWGYTDLGRYSKHLSDDLKAAEVDLLDTNTCNIKLKAKVSNKWSGMQDYQLCAADLRVNGTGDVCDGDSGGPIQVKMKTSTNKAIYNAIGITSFGSYCGSPELPSVYTNVSSFIDWIEHTVWRNQTKTKLISSNNPSTVYLSVTPASSRPLVKPTVRPPARPTTTNSVVSSTTPRPTNTYPSFKPFTFPPFFKPPIRPPFITNFIPHIVNFVPYGVNVPNIPSLFNHYNMNN